MQPKLNPIFARYCFINEVQDSENIDAFVTRLKNKAQDCSFAEKENMICDRIVFGCYNEKCSKNLINEGEKLTMDKAIQIVQNYAYCQKQLQSMIWGIGIERRRCEPTQNQRWRGGSTKIVASKQGFYGSSTAGLNMRKRSVRRTGKRAINAAGITIIRISAELNNGRQVLCMA